MSISDLILAPLFLLMIFLFARYRVNKNIESKPYYKYYIPGLFVKLFGGLGVCIIYTYYYGGGDTINYFQSDLAMLNLMVKSPATFVSILNGNLSYENYSVFDLDTGFPSYYYDKHTFIIVRLTTLICLLAFKSYLVTTFLLAWFCYSGIWRLFRLFCEEFPTLIKQIAVAIFFVPSVVFWGSGVLKDTVTFSAICWFSFGFYKVFIKRENIAWNIVCSFIAMYFILAIKPYILYSLLPGAFLWLAYSNLGNINNKIIRYFVAPFLLLGGSVSIFLLLQQLGKEMGKFNVDDILQRAVITQQDLIKDYNGGNTFDIGKFDATIPSMLSKAPIAIISCLFRPFIWEAQNIVMFISAIENTVIALFTIIILLKLRVVYFFIFLRKNPILIYIFSFSICFAFSVGLSTPNFGSLVRYRIPSIPFFLISMILLRFYFNKQREENITKSDLDEEHRLAAKTRFQAEK